MITDIIDTMPEHLFVCLKAHVMQSVSIFVFTPESIGKDFSDVHIAHVTLYTRFLVMNG